MVKVRAFQGHRAHPELVEYITNYPEGEAEKRVVENNPYSFSRIQQPQVDLEEQVDQYDPQVYQQGRRNLLHFLHQGWFIQDNHPACYIYAQTLHNKTQYGIVGESFVGDYHDNLIRKHEDTRQKKQQERTKFMAVQGCNSGPVHLFYQDSQHIDHLVQMVVLHQSPVVDTTTYDGVRHTIWIVSPGESAEIQRLFEQVERVYIADGHHRAASAYQLANHTRHQRLLQGQPVDEQDDYNYFMSILYPQTQLQVLDYNRVVKSLNNHPPSLILAMLEKHFHIQPLDTTLSSKKPSQKGTINMLLQHQWYSLHKYTTNHNHYTTNNNQYTTNNNQQIEEQQDILDVDILSTYILQPILGIDDQRNDNRIDFIDGVKGVEEIEKRCEQDCQVGFVLFPVPIHQVARVADQGRNMPPKSTWFTPKPREGFILRLFNTTTTY